MQQGGEEGQEDQEVRWEQLMGGDRWDLLAYHRTKQIIQFKDLHVNCEEIDGPYLLEDQRRVIQWQIEQYSEEATAFYQISITNYWLNLITDRHFGPSTLKALLQETTIILNLTLPSVWYPPDTIRLQL